ncbi:hypothetical protein CSE16_08025 [Solibacillus sp. R5-41]|uniref:hypothetical protein n=1 Tax=Solibacillus sp. R5-41 TaxID=2048654 RepID=UPI000C126C2F|nr:hypothetical protein [Solibacillus sp. R5-41]ATP40001.1 hypothetical protein CSE16_08025 [Solibacillus sp. R5-41]
MDWMILIAFLGFLAICLILIIITLVSLTRLGDERKKFIKMKAQSYTFIVVIGYLIIEIGENIYKTIWGNGSYTQIGPFSFLVTISGVYLISLFFFKKKYGG